MEERKITRKTELNKAPVKTRILASSALALGLSCTGLLPVGTAVGATPVIAALGGEFVEFFSGLSEGVAGSFLADYIQRQPDDFRTVLANRDLERAAGQALGLIMQREAGRLDEEQRKALDKVAVTATERFLLVNADLDTTDLAGLFGTRAENFGKNLALTEADWAEVVHTLGKKSVEELPWRERRRNLQPLDAETVDRVAQALHAGFPDAFCNVLKQDAEDGGRAFGGMVLLLLSQILVAVRERPAEAGVTEAAVVDAMKHVAGELSEDARQRHAEVLNRLAEQDDRLADLKTTVTEEAEQTRGTVRDEHEQTRAVVADLAGRFEDAPPASPKPTLPEVTRHFTGRGGEVENILTLLEGHRLVTLTGTGGIGKTEVARAVCQKAEQQQPAWAEGGVFYANLEAAESAAAVLDALVLQLGLKPVSTPASLAPQLAGERLYVLDDLFPAFRADRKGTRGLVDALFVHAAPARFLLTCRSALLPSKSRVVSLDRLHPPADEDLFRSVAEHAGYAWRDGDDERLERLLHAEDGLDGLPLALTLAAERLRNRSLERALHDWTTRRTKALQLPGLDDEDRSRLDSVDYSVALSYDALPEGGPARALFALFAHLPGGATEDLLDAVLGGDGLDAADVLARNGLVRREDDRFTMLMPLRAFADAYAAQPADDLRPRLDQYLLELATHWGIDNAQWIETQGEAVRRLTAAMPNLHSALDRAGARKDHAYVAHLTDALWRFYPYALPGPEAVERLEAGAEAARCIKNWQRRANCIQSLGDVHMNLAEYHEARKRYEEALPIYRITGAPLGKANCIHSLGNVHRMLDEYPEACKHYEKAQSIYRAIGNPLGEASCIQSLGEVHANLSEYPEARKHYEEALPIYRATGSRLDEANCIRSLGEVYFWIGEPREARERYEEARAIYRAISARPGEANCIRSLGDVHMALAEYPAAHERYEEARAIYHAIGARLGEANCIHGLGKVYSRLGKSHEARKRYEEARAICRAIKNRLGEANCIQGLGDVHMDLTEYPEARKRYEEALPIYHDIGAPLSEANCIRSLGDVHKALKEFKKARVRYEKALAIYEAIENRYSAAITYALMGEIAAAESHRDTACAWMTKAANGFTAIGHEPYAAQARSTLEAWGCPDA